MHILSRRYYKFTASYPTLSMAILTGSMMGFGNLISQIIVKPSDNQTNRISHSSILQFATYGFFIAGPLLHHWFQFLDRFFPVTQQNRSRALKMVVIDQVLLCPICYSIFTLYNYWWNQKDMEYVKLHFKKDVGKVLLDNYKVWPLLQFVNFNFIPLRHRVLFLNTSALFWNVYVAWLFRATINNTSDKLTVESKLDMTRAAINKNVWLWNNHYLLLFFVQDMPPIRDMNIRFGFLGCGQMGFAMAKALIGPICEVPEKVNVFDAFDERRAFLKTHGFSVMASNKEVIEASHVIVLCVKPNDCPDLLKLEHRSLDSKLVISVAAGLELDLLSKCAPKARFVRIVTNLAAVCNSAISAYSAQPNCNEDDLRITEAFLACFGESVGRLDESKLHAVSAVSSSSLAFVCTAIDGMTDGGVQLGLPRAISAKLASYAALGTGKLLSTSTTNASGLRDSVCSPGGTTIRGVRRLERESVRSAFMEAVIDTCERSIEIMKESQQDQ